MHSLLTHYLPLYFPEVEKYFSTSRAQWFPRTLIRFTIPTSITRHDFGTFCEIASELVGCKSNKRQWLYDFYQTAQESIGLPADENSLAVETFRLVLRQYLELNEVRQRLERLAEEKLAGHEDYHRLKTLPGVGETIGDKTCTAFV